MNTLEILPFILFIVVIVTAISEKINVPYPLLLVIAGLVVGFIPGIPSWHPPSDIVLPLFLPPILFSAARLISWRDVTRNIGVIVSLSGLLVVVTTIVIALVLDYFIPAIPLSAALVLGAIISPTDTVAATAILSRMNVRQHIIRTIEIESLFNDAMGIVLYQVGLVFVILGTVSVGHASIKIFLVGAGGILVGLIFAYFTSLIIEQFLSRSENELPIIMSLILAYVSYLFATRVGVSGVLAVVAAGLYHRRTELKIEARTRLSEKQVWDTLIFFLNGLVFITIGIQFPSYLDRVSNLAAKDLLAFSVLTIVALLVLRLLWVTLTAYGSRFYARLRKQEKTSHAFSYKKIIIVSWSGMRGLVSLALAIAIPSILPNNQQFPFRDLIIFLTIITILFTLLAQGLTLPFVIKWFKAGKDDHKELKKTEEIYQRITKQAMKSIGSFADTEKKLSKEAKKLVENYYANRLLRFTMHYEIEADTHEVGHEAELLLGRILEHERELLDKMRRRGKISEEIYIKILHKLDRDQVGFASYK